MSARLRADQAIFTSMERRGAGSGYHLVARSPQVAESEAGMLARWCPSQGLLQDHVNAVSVNFHKLPTERFALSRTCRGPAEYSGRGGDQLYTHALIFHLDALKLVEYQVFALYREAMALGHLVYRAYPESVPPAVDLLEVHRVHRRDHWEERARAHELPLAAVRRELGGGQPVRFAFGGDRLALAECLFGTLDAKTIVNLSVSTSLQPSNVRPYRLCLIAKPA